ncbi:MAG: protein kinase [Phycisphaerales bacterium]|nr:protein kinase [Phycisphaerales bacterium]
MKPSLRIVGRESVRRTRQGTMKPLRARQKLGKYRIVKKLGDGGFAVVYHALDTITGVPVALKIPHASLMTGDSLGAFRREVKLTAKLDHPNILPIKDAGFIDSWFVIATPLGKRTLADRLHTRVSAATLLAFTRQMLDALAYAHRKGIMHCDVKPENFILFPENQLRLADFGIARFARNTVRGSGSGTVGYLAPEQALGKPSMRSDVFSLALIIYRMFAGRLPEWPFEWPPPGSQRLAASVHPDFVALLRRALTVDHRKRFADAERMRAAFDRIRTRALRPAKTGRRRRAERVSPPVGGWRTVRYREFQRRLGKPLETRFHCGRCGGPVSEQMRGCPWCGTKRDKHTGDSRFPKRCPRCRRGVKSDWRFCPWCFGGMICDSSQMRYTDKRYCEKCANANCFGSHLMAWMRYCPWCRVKVRRKWLIPGMNTRCGTCGWGVATEYWEFCPWCTRRLRRN